VIRPYNPRRDGAIADLLWRDPEGADLPAWPAEWTPLGDFLRDSATRYADRLIGTFRHDISIRSVLFRRAFHWCLRHLFERLAEVEVAERQADGTFRPITINSRGQYRMRHNALERLTWTAVGRSSRVRGAEVAEAFEDPHVKGMIPPKKATEATEVGEAEVTAAKAEVTAAEAKSDVDVAMVEKLMAERMIAFQRKRIEENGQPPATNEELDEHFKPVRMRRAALKRAKAQAPDLFRPRGGQANPKA
jgi:hypothetical protein